MTSTTQRTFRWWILYASAWPLIVGDVITVQLYVDEESPSETLVGDLRTALRSKINASLLHQYQFSLLPRPNQNLSGFSIDRDKGHLLTTSFPLDRETICPQARPVDCIVDLNVGLSRATQLELLVSAKVLILDVNDYAPSFPQPQYEVRISELATPGTSVALPTATDLDSPQFGIKTYRLRSNFQEFQLKLVNSSHSLSPIPHMTLTKKLRLNPEPYSLLLEAFDLGTPMKSGSTLILVTVEDANDHAPTFERETVQVQVREDHTLDSAIYRLSATDDDRGLNAEISYIFAPGTNIFHGTAFRLDRSSGQIFLKQLLDFESENSYQLEVMAVDAGNEPQTGHQTVIVQVEDVNDNAPQLTINTLSSHPRGDSDNAAEVPENAPPGTFVLHVSVYDADTGPNGQVSCRLWDEPIHFSLDLMAAGQYKLMTLATFDYETDHAFVVTIECSDNGQPMMTIRQNVTVSVVDMNDNEPQFSELYFNVTIQENNLPDSVILQVKATDKDTGVNAELVYSIVEPFALQYVSIEPNTSIVRAITVLDHEAIQSFSFTIRVVDSGSPVHSASVQVIINVEDTNDEEPQFLSDSYEFSVPENSPPGTLIGFVSAVDRDSPPFNQFVFKIVDAFSSDMTELFAIDPRSGKLIAKRSFDREIRDEYSCTVTAIDQDRPSLRSDAIITIRILDENDNWPSIAFPLASTASGSIDHQSSDIPDPENSSFPVSNAVPRGYAILKVVAKDADSGDNARLTYGLANGNDLFSVDPSNGVLATKSEFHDVTYDRHRIRVTVHDAGYPARTSAVDVTVVIDASIPYEDTTTTWAPDWQDPRGGGQVPDQGSAERHGNDDGSSHNLFIVIVVCSVVAAVLILLAIVIVAVKLHERRNQPQAIYHCREQERKVMDKIAEKNYGSNDSEETEKNECPLNHGNSNYSINSQKIIKEDRNGDNVRGKTGRTGGGGGGGGGNGGPGGTDQATDYIASLERKLLWELKEEEMMADAESSSLTDVSGDSGVGTSEESDRYGFGHYHQCRRIGDSAKYWSETDSRQSFSLPRNSGTVPYFASTFKGVPHSTTQILCIPTPLDANRHDGSHFGTAKECSRSHEEPPEVGDSTEDYLCAQPQTAFCPLNNNIAKELHVKRLKDRKPADNLVDEIRRYRTRMAKFPAHSSALRSQTPTYLAKYTFYADADEEYLEEEEDEDDLGLNLGETDAADADDKIGNCAFVFKA